MSERAVFPDFSAFQMTMASGSVPNRAAVPGTVEETSKDPAPVNLPGAGSGTGPGAGVERGQLNTPPFSWLGGDAWPNFRLCADKTG